MFEDDLSAALAEYNSLRTREVEGKLDIILQRKQTRAHIEHLRSVIDNLTQQIDDIASGISKLVDRQKDLYYPVVTNMLNTGEPLKILLRNMRTAINTNTEFKHRFFTQGLLEACRNPSTIVITRGANSASIHVVVDLNATAGSIQDWANAVKKVRGQLGKGVDAEGLSSPSDTEEFSAIKSHFWAEKFYGPAREGKKVSRRKYNRKTKEYSTVDITSKQIKKYWDTMKKRMEASGKPAPYWEILDKGSAVMTGSGTPYPVSKPTNFTERTEIAIKQLYRKIYMEQVKIIQKEMNRLESVQKGIKTERAGVIQEKKEYERLLRKQMKEGGKITPEVLLYSRVVGLAERTGRRYSRSKLEQAIRTIQREGIGGLSITAAGRLELTESGQPRFRVSINRIISQFGL